MALQRHLLIFARQPRLGTGKKRLACDVGSTESLRFQRIMLEYTIRRLGKNRLWKTALAVTPDKSKPWPGHLSRYPQGPGDLGSRLSRLFAALPSGPVVVIGSDLPSIRPHHIASAFRLLGANDAVLGPASDGGYWLIGLRRRPKVIKPFAHVRWSTQHALSDTLANLSGKKVALLCVLEDVDDSRALSNHPRWAVFHNRDDAKETHASFLNSCV